MSIKDRLTKKTEGLFFAGKVEGATASPAAPLRTGPGQMLMVNSLMKESNEKVALLELRIKEFDGAVPVRLIDADKIVTSKWVNRISANFESPDFLRLKAEIKDAEGNVQPIKVRPLAGSSDHYEIVFGHRRHRACLDLGFQVLAFVEGVNDQELFKAMERENRGRLDLSPWEQGRMYRQALNEGLFSSLGKLAKEIGIDKSNLSKALRLAEIPEAVLDAFPSPLGLQYRWAKMIDDALKIDANAVLDRAKQLTNSGKQHSAKEVLAVLLGSKPKSIVEREIVVGGKSLAKVRIEGGRVSVHFDKGVVSDDKVKRLQTLMKEFLQE